MDKPDNFFFRFWKWWFTSLSTDPTVLYRERALRILIPLIILLRGLGTLVKYSGYSNTPAPYVPLWVNLTVFLIPIALSIFFLTKQEVGWAGAFFILHWYLIDLFSLPVEGYWYPGYQISLIIQAVLAALLLPSRAILPFMLFQLTTVGIWGHWLDVNYYNPPMLSTGEPVTSFWISFTTLAVQESIIIFIVYYLRMQMEKSLRLQQATISQMENEISERQHAEARLRGVVENSPDLILEIDRTSTIILANRGAEIYTGNKVGQFILADQPTLVETAISRAFESGKPATLELQTREHDGSFQWNSIRISPVHLGDQVTSMVAIITNIHAQKEAALHAQQRAEQLATIVEIGHAVSKLQDLESVLEIIYQQIQRIASADALFICLVDEDKKHLTFPLTYDMGVRYNQADSLMTPGTPLAHVIETGEIYRIHRTLEQIAELENEPGDVGNPQLRSKSLLYLPLWQANQVIGALSVQSYSLNSYPDELVETLTGIGDQVAVAIQNARLFTSVQQELAERQRAEREALRLEDLYRRAINAAGAVPYYRDFRTNTYSFMGEGILQMTGYTAAEMTPEIWDTLELEGFPRGKLAGLTYEEADRLTESENSFAWECDYRIRARDGQIRWVADTSVVGFDVNGEQAGVVGILQDISKRKNAEEMTLKVNFELQRRIKELYVLNDVAQAGASAKNENEMLEIMVESLHRSLYPEIVGVALWDESAGLLHTHSSAHRGLPASASEMTARPNEGIVGIVAATCQPYRLKDINDPNYFAIAPDIRSELCVPILAGDKLVGVLDVESRQPDAFSDADEHLLITIAGQLATALERLRVEQQLRTLNSELEQRVVERTSQLEAANNELEAFSYSVSHDLRAPLRAINSFTRIVRDDFSAGMDQMGVNFLDKVLASGNRMNRLIDGLLEFSRTGRKPLNKQDVDMHAIARDVIDSLAPETENRQIEWIVTELPPAQADPVLIHQVYANLIGNAIKYSRNLSLARIEVSCIQKDGKPAYFVRDNGAGFDMKYADKLFGVFERLHRDEDFEGTGIGLATVQRIVHRHGGLIWAESEPDKGATFYFTLR